MKGVCYEKDVCGISVIVRFAVRASSNRICYRCRMVESRR